MVMATRNLTDTYVNLRTEISRFKAYSLGDSGVRCDSPGVVYIIPRTLRTNTVLFTVRTRHNLKHTDASFLYGLKQDDDTVALVRRTSDLELGVQAGGISSLPPQWCV